MSSGLPEKLLLSRSFGGAHQNRFAGFVVGVLQVERGSDDLLGRNAVGLFGIGAHEVLSASGDEVGLVAVGAKVLHDFQHGLVDELGVGAVPARIFGGGDPVVRDLLEVVDRHSGMGCHHDGFQVLGSELRHGGLVAGKHSGERGSGLPLGMLGRGAATTRAKAKMTWV